MPMPRMLGVPMAGPPSWALLAAVLLAGAAGAAQGQGGLGRSRPYAVLKAQNLVLLGSIFSILLMAIILLAVCVYKPIRRR